MTYEEALKTLEEKYIGIGSNDLFVFRKAAEAINKQIPKKPRRYVTPFPSCCMVSKCPNCQQEFGFNTEFNFCENCGQRLNWSESIDNEDE